MRNFNHKEFMAMGVEGSGFDYMNIVLLSKLDDLRDACGFPFHITSAYRTPEWDIAKGRSGNSQHTMGKAVDIRVTNGAQRAKIVEEAIKLGFKGIGVHKDFVHVDVRDGVRVLWVY